MKNYLKLLDKIIIPIFYMAMLAGCSDDVATPPSASHLTVTIQTTNKQQTINGFGASDAWSTQFVGKNWPLSKREQMADWLFSVDADGENNPKGIGLSIWRFNLGAGSTYQGGASGISDEWRRAESFMALDGSFNAQAHSGQRWFLSAAKNRGVEKFIAFVNSPPVALTKNTKTFSNGGSSVNLEVNNFTKYSSFMVDALTEINNADGISFQYISPFNEPQWDWDNAGQEGSPWRNSEISELVKILNTDLMNSSLSVKIELPEAAQLNFLYESGSRSGRDDQLDAFFESASSTYVGNLERVEKKVAGHSYFTTWNLSNFIEVRKKLAEKMASYPELEFEMSEYCPLENNSEINGNGRDLSMDMALYSARVIHTDLTVANASSWQWWLAISPYDYKDGLVYIDYNEQDGQLFDSKTLWSLGNYSRFIRPGFVRALVIRSDLRTIEQTLDGIMVSGFIDPATNKSVAVALNYGTQAIPVDLAIDNKENARWKYYRTSDVPDENLKYLGEYASGDVITIPGRSIMTFVEQ